MLEALAHRPAEPGQTEDQAAGLRRLFAPPAARLLPVFAGRASTGQGRWLAQLGEAFARAGQRTLLVDAARAHIATTFGLRARFDLLHALTGQCGVDAVQLDAAPGLTVVSAARACERAAASGGSLPALLAPLLGRGVDVVLLLLPPSLARLIAGGDALVPVMPTRESVRAAVSTLGEAGSRQGSLTFRLLFLAMDRTAAATLGRRMAETVGVRSNARLAQGVVASVARDLARVVVAANGYALSGIAPAAPRTGSGDLN
jgi:hypothetical protein